MTRPITRIVTASGLVVVLIAAALAATVWGYRDAVGARDRALAAATEIAVANAAETYFFREREAMDEYLVTRETALRGEIASSRAGLRLRLSQVGVGEGREVLFVRRALEGNEDLLAKFAAYAAVAARRGEAGRGLETKFGASEDQILIPLRELRSMNDRQVRKARQRANFSSRRALVAGILAGLIAIAGGLAFAFYALRLVREIDSRNRRLRRHDQMKDDFVASVSHELRTPLTSIRGYLELLGSGEVGELNEEQQRFISVVDRNADRLLHVVGDLLFVSQVEAGVISLEKRPFELVGLLTEAVDAANPTAEAKDISIRLSADHVAEVDADRARLAQVFDNLISNAIKFTPPGGRIVVRAVGRGDHVRIEVSDSGMGISPEDQRRLFRRFFRTSAANEQAIQGTGLGLAIVKAIVDGHGGRITVESKVGSGTTFRVDLPLAVREPVAV